MTVTVAGAAVFGRLSRLPHSARTMSVWAKVPMGPPDPILGVAEAYRRDQDPKKVNVGVGAYRDDNGKPYVLPAIREADKRILAKKMDKEYAPIDGSPLFCKLVMALAFGKESKLVKKGNVATVQSLSGTGALRVCAAFIEKFYPARKEIYIPTPSWAQHATLFGVAGLKVKQYRYYDPKTRGLDCRGLLEDISKMPENAIILFHASAHNPTGVDPNREQWEAISETTKKRKLFPLFDMAYQGFASGDLNRDAFAPRLFVSQGQQIAVAQSFAKNMGLYNERIGALHLICANEQEKQRMLSQIKIIIRSLYSNPPLHGARIVIEVLSDQKLRQQWERELKAMAERIISARQQLRENLEGVGSQLSWNHITDQIGMFCFTGLNEQQVGRLTKEFHIYLTKNGRISMAGVTSKNVMYLACAMHEVSK